MSSRQEKIYLEWEANSNLGTVEQQMERLIALTQQQATVTAASVASQRLDYERESASIKENARLREESIKQQARLDAQAVNERKANRAAELRQEAADLAQEVADFKASRETLKSAQIAADRERTALSAAIAKEAAVESIEAQRRLTITLKALKDKELEDERQLNNEINAEEKRNSAESQAILRADLKEQQSIRDAAQRTAEADQLAAHKSSLAAQQAADKSAANQSEAILKADLKTRQSIQDAADREAFISMKAQEERLTNSEKAELQERLIAAKANAQMIVDAQRAAAREQLEEHKKVSSGIDGIISNLRDMRTIIGASFSLYEVVEFGKQVIDAKSKVDTFKLGLTQMIGSKREMNDLYVDIVKLANETPFEVEGLFETVFNLKGMGVATQELIPTLKALGDMSAVAGQEKLPLIAKAYTDVMNKGKLMKQELNQFAENGIPLYDLMADSMDKPRKAVIKMAEAHEISFDQVKKAIMDSTDVGGRYYHMMQMQAETLGGQVSNLSDRFFIAKSVLGDYFENGLSRVITGLKNLIIQVAGSDGAISRSTGLASAIAIAYGAWTLANSRLVASLTVKKAALLESAVAEGAYTLVVGTMNLLLITAAGTTDMFSAAQVRSAAAARVMWASLAANPIGLLIGLVGTAIAAYTAWSAVNEQATQAITDQEVALKREQVGIVTGINNTMLLKEGTKERANAMQLLINKYPDLFAGMNAERVTNLQLRQVLEQVNGSYRTRIALAAEAYKAELNEEKFKASIKSMQEIFAIAAQRLPAELMVKINGDPKKLLEAIESSDETMKKFNGGMIAQIKQLFNGYGSGMSSALKDVIKSQGEYEVEVAAGESRMKALKVQSTAELITIEKQRHTTVLAQLKAANDGSAADVKEFNTKSAAEETRYQDTLLSIKKEAKNKVEKTEDDHAVKLKSINAASAKAIREIQLNMEQMSYEDKKKYYTNLENLEIESINKVKVNRKASDAELDALRDQKLKDISIIHEKYVSIQKGLILIEKQNLSEGLQAEIDSFQARNNVQHEYTTKVTTGFKEIARAAKERAADEIAAEKELQTERAHTAQLVKEADRAEEISRRKIIALIADFASEASPMLGAVAKGVLQVVDNMDALTGAAARASKTAVNEAQEHLKQLEIIYNAGMGGTKKGLEDAKQQVAETQKTAAKANSDSAIAVFGVMQAIYQVLSAVAAAINEMILETNKAIAKGLADVRDAYRDLNEVIQRNNEESYKRDLAAFSGTLDQKLAMIDGYYKREKEYIAGRDRIDAELSYQAEMAQIAVDAGTNVKKLIEGMIEARKNHDIAVQQGIINLAEAEMKAAQDTRDAKIAAIDAAFDKFKEANQAQQDLAKETADKEKDLAATKRDADKDAVDKWLQGKKDAYSLDLQAAKDAYQLNVDAVRTAYDAQVAIVKAAQDAEQAAIKATYDLKQSLLNQATADQIEAVGILDRVRVETLGRYETDERARITATRDRILANLTDETERKNVISEYDRQLAALHEAVETGKLDKSKGVSLATTQLNKEAKEESERLKAEETATLTALAEKFQQVFLSMAADRDTTLKKLKEDEEIRERELKAEMTKLERQAADEKEKIQLDYKERIATLEKELKDQIAALKKELQDKALADNGEKKRIEFELKVATINYQREVFEAQKQMKIAELQADIAVLNSKKNWFNEGKIIDAVGKIEQSIAAINGLALTNQVSLGEYLNAYDLNAMGNPKRPITVDGSNGGNVPGEVFDKAGNPIQITYREDMTAHTVYDKAGNAIQIAQASGYVPATGERFFKGTESVGGDYPNGIDTVPAWLTKEERVMTVEQNKQLNGISNNELVRRSVFFEQIAQVNGPLLGGPAGIAAVLSRAPDSTGNMGGLLAGLREVLADQPHLHVNMDEVGFRKNLTAGLATIDLHTNLLTR